MKFASMLRRLRNTQGGMGSTSSSSYTPYVDPPDDPFEVDAGMDQTVSIGDRVQFEGTVSNAPEGVLTYTWAFGDGATDAEDVNGLMPSCVYNTLGERTVRLTVSYTDANGNLVEAFDEVTITVIAVVPPPPPPVVDTSRPLTTIHVPPQRDVTRGEPFDITVEFSEPVTGFEQSDLKFSGNPSASIRTFEARSGDMEYVFTFTANEGTITFGVDENVAQNAAGRGNHDAVNAYVTVPPETFTFTGLPANVPLPPFPLPVSPKIVNDPNVPPPVPPDYAVPVRVTGSAPPKTPELQIQADRIMSPLEDSIVDMVFGDSPSFEKTVTDANVTIAVLELLEYDSGDRPNAWTRNGVTEFSQARFKYTPNIDGSSTIDDLTTEQKNSPGMLKYIYVLVHELTHWWQTNQHRQEHVWRSGYRTNYDRYQFTEAQLTQNLFVDKEAHASAVATAAVIEWQLTHRPEGQLINITSTERSSKSEEWVGSVDRYLKIKGMEYQDASDDYNMAPPVGKWITRADAQTLLADFRLTLNEVRTAQPLPEPDEE